MRSTDWITIPGCAGKMEKASSDTENVKKNVVNNAYTKIDSLCFNTFDIKKSFHRFILSKQARYL